jgi:cytochrome P450
MKTTLPGPRLPAPIQTAMLMRDPVGYLERCERRYGPIFRVKLIGFPRYVYVTDPQLAREVYAADRTVGRAAPARQAFLEPMLGRHSLLCLEGDDWLRQRKLLGPAFHRHHVDGFEREIAGVAARSIEDWPLEQTLELRPRFQEITLEVILRIVFGLTDRERLSELRRLLPELIDAGGSLVLFAVPPQAWRRLDRSRIARRAPNPLRRVLRVRDAVDALLYSEIAARREVAGDPDRRDVLSMLIRARDDEGGAMSDVELRDELVTLLLAGHETTATALAWTFERLMRAPAALRRLLLELEAGDDAYLEAVVKEALRTRTVVLDTPRLLEGPVAIGRHEIPAGWYVAPALPLVQRTRTAWSEPEAFRPERFLEGDGAREGWIPFGGGKRHCVGSHLALLEMKVIVREVLMRVELEPVGVQDERPRMQHVTLVPSELARARLRRRTKTAAGATRSPGRPAPPRASGRSGGGPRVR